MASGTISMGVDGYLEGQIVWSSSSNGSSANSSTVTASLQIRRTNSYTTTGTWTGNLNIGGTSQDYSYYSGVTNSWVTVKSFSITKGHSDDGSGSCYIYGKVVGPSGTSMAGKVLTGEQTVTLDKIPRYASITTFSGTGQTLNTASFKWATNVNCSKIEYKIGSGSYVNLGKSGTSGTFKVSGLAPSTNYKFKLRVTRSDSGLTTESSEVSVTTQAIATITSASDFNIGTNPTIKFTNPSGNAIAVYMEMDSANTNISGGTYTVTGKTEYQFTKVDASKIYASIPSANSKSIRYVIRTTEGSNNYYNSVTKTAYVVNSNPTVGSFTYKDNNSTVSTITGNNQRIVRNQSNLLFSIGSATAKNSATISKYEVTFNGETKARTSTGTLDFGKINLSYTTSAVLKVIDSRGNSATKSINVTIDDWVSPTGSISLKRKNNFENETYLIVDGTYSSVNSKNTMTIKYQYKKTTDPDYGTEVTIKDNTQVTLSLDNKLAWNFIIQVSDKFASTEYNVILPIGKPIVFIDVKTLKIGINGFPTTSGETVQIEGSLETTGKAKIGGALEVTGASNLKGGASVTGDLAVTGKVKGYTLGNACAKGVKTLSAKGPTGWTNQTDGDAYLITKAFMAFWNGAYSGTNSNLEYCSKGLIRQNNFAFMNYDRKTYTCPKAWTNVAMSGTSGKISKGAGIGFSGDTIKITNDKVKTVKITGTCMGFANKSSGDVGINVTYGSTTRNIFYESNDGSWEAGSAVVFVVNVSKDMVIKLEVWAGGANSQVEQLGCTLLVEDVT